MSASFAKGKRVVEDSCGRVTCLLRLLENTGGCVTCPLRLLEAGGLEEGGVKCLLRLLGKTVAREHRRIKRQRPQHTIADKFIGSGLLVIHCHISSVSPGLYFSFRDPLQKQPDHFSVKRLATSFPRPVLKHLQRWRLLPQL